MAIFACHNGRIANGSVCAIVSAPTEQDAIVQALAALKAAGVAVEVREVELLELPHVCELA